jgi:hypothetical protein
VIRRRLSEGATARQVRRSEFLDGFTEVPAELPLQNVFPKMRTVVYRTKCPYWKTEGVRKVVKEARLYTEPALNPEQHLLLFVTHELEMVDWGDIKGLQNTIWDLYLLHWDRERRLLFINSSNNDSLHEELAKAIAGDDVERIRGEEVFRSLHGLNQLILMNLGLNHSLSRAVRFTMYVGPDIRQGLAEAHLENKIKSNLFARGYEQGDKASIGCSYKGRIWSYKIADGIAEWVEWCHHIEAKLLDETISVKDILEHVIIPKSIDERPPLVPLTIEWSEAFLQRSEDAIHLEVAGEQVAFFDAGLELVEHERNGPIRFRIFTETLSVEYEVRFKPNSVEYIPLGQDDVNIIIARKSRRLSDWFQVEPPVIRFEDGGFLIYNSLYTPRRDRHPYDRERIAAWDWTGIDLGKESQKLAKRSDSIQCRVIQELLHPSHDPQYDIVFDDDDTYEAADIVAIKVAGEHLLVHLFHQYLRQLPRADRGLYGMNTAYGSHFVENLRQ